MRNESIRMRRAWAFLLDLMFLYLPCICCAAILRFSFFGNLAILIALIAGIGLFVTFIMRDYLFKGRSIGKRIVKLRVLDADMLSEPSAKQLIVKGLFFFLYPIDGLFLIASGKSLGERATRTVVLREQQLPCTDPLSSSPHSVSEDQGVIDKKRITIAIVIVLFIALSMFIMISAVLNAVKEQENYQIAYSYLVDSDAYAELQVDESQITLTGYSANTRIDNDGDTASAVVTFTFLVQGQQYQVVCHQDGDIWYVCGDCTDFR